MTTPTGVQVTGYSFKYTTPGEGDDGGGNIVPIEIPTEFVLGGVAEDVAQGILTGLQTVTTINNPTCEKVLQGYQAL